MFLKSELLSPARSKEITSPE